MDPHNQLVAYHGIITRALADLYDVMPSSATNRSVIGHALYRALNHLRQRMNVYGAFQYQLEDPTNYEYTGPCMTAILFAHTALGGTTQGALNTITNAAINMPLTSGGYETINGHNFAALGMLFDQYPPPGP